MRASHAKLLLAFTLLFIPTYSYLAHAQSRPSTEAAMLQPLNGEPTRWFMSDGGASGMYGSGQQCMSVDGGSVLKMNPTADAYFCFRTSLSDGGYANGWDGGCNTIAGDINCGDLAVGGQPYFIILQSTTNKICQVPASGSVSTPVFKMK